MENILITPYAPNLVESTRSIGYLFETAMADIIDNSISNLAKRIDVNFSSNDEPYIAIIDNGSGMTESELEQAMRYGSTSALEEREIHDLGRFGLGLKMASMSQCRKLTVISKKNNLLTAACWDLDHIHSTENWSLIKYDPKEIKGLKCIEKLLDYESGTIVLWEKLDRISDSSTSFNKLFEEKMNFSDKHMALVFHKYLDRKPSKNSLNLYFNNRKIEPIDPYFLSNVATQQLEEETLFLDRVSIKVIPYITPYISKLSQKERSFLNEYKELNLKQGLYIYRNDRLIVWGKWFRLLSDGELKRLAKVQINLPNSIDKHWSIDVKKSSAQIPSMIRADLKNIVLRVAGKSEQVYRYRGRKVIKNNQEYTWNRIENRDKFQYLINKDTPIFQALINSLDDQQIRLLEGFLKSLELGFPYTSVYYDLAQDKEFNNDIMENEQIYQIAKNTIENLSNDKNEQLLQLQKLFTIDFFKEYPDVLNLLMEELQ